MNNKQRIAEALRIALRYGQCDGGHHKMWVIDQMIRALCGVVEDDKPNPEYTKLIRDYEIPDADIDGEDANKEYSWDTGIAP